MAPGMQILSNYVYDCCPLGYIYHTLDVDWFLGNQNINPFCGRHPRRLTCNCVQLDLCGQTCEPQDIPSRAPPAGQTPTAPSLLSTNVVNMCSAEHRISICWNILMWINILLPKTLPTKGWRGWQLFSRGWIPVYNFNSYFVFVPLLVLWRGQNFLGCSKVEDLIFGGSKMGTIIFFFGGGVGFKIISK